MAINYVKKINEEGEVAVIYSPGYGAGWSTWNSSDKKLAQALVFDSDLVDLILADKSEEITNEYLQEKYGMTNINVCGQKDLRVAWVAQGVIFEINVHDGNERIDILNMGDDIYCT